MNTKLKLRPSSSARWLSCTGSLVLSEKIPPVKTLDRLKAAAEGTVAHELLEVSLQTGDDPQHTLGKAMTVFEEDEMEFPITFHIDQEMIDGVKFFLNHVKDYEGEKYTELQMKHSQIPNLMGTADYVNINKTHLNLDDLKYGKSTVMAVYRNGTINTQLLCYASLAFDKWPFLETATMSIVQPRAKTKKKVRSVDIDKQDIEAFKARVEAVGVTLQQIENKTLPIIESLSNGGHCWFCPAKNTCPLLRKKAVEEDFSEI